MTVPSELHKLWKLATDPAVGADGLDGFVEVFGIANLTLTHGTGGHERAGGAGLNTFPAGNAG